MVGLAGAAVRFAMLDGGAPSADEAFSWRVAAMPLSDLMQRVAGDTHPPLHFLILKAWMAVAG